MFFCSNPFTRCHKDTHHSAQFLGKDQRKILFPSELFPQIFPSAILLALPYTYSETGLLTMALSRARSYSLVSFLFTYSLCSCYSGEWEKKNFARCKWKRRVPGLQCEGGIKSFQLKLPGNKSPHDPCTLLLISYDLN